MALNGCSIGLVVTAVAALLLLPVQYYVPDQYLGVEDPLLEQPESPSSAFGCFDFGFGPLPLFDLVLIVTLLIIVMSIYLSEWIQIKRMERRIVKLNQYLGASVERLRALDAQQEQLELTLEMVQNAITEYNLLLYLLLHQHCGHAGHDGPPTASSTKDSKKTQLNA